MKYPGMVRLALLLLALIGRVLGAETKDQVLLFSYFVGNGEDGLHLATSEDGLKWTALRGGASFLQPVAGENKLMRDPCLKRRSILRNDDESHMSMLCTAVFRARPAIRANSPRLDVQLVRVSGNYVELSL